jgi:hypothetical protein
MAIIVRLRFVADREVTSPIPLIMEGRREFRTIGTGPVSSTYTDQQFIDCINDLERSTRNSGLKIWLQLEETGDIGATLEFIRQHSPLIYNVIVSEQPEVNHSFGATSDNLDSKMNAQERLRRLEELLQEPGLTQGFQSREACLEWASKVAPLLKYDPTYHDMFVAHFERLAMPLSANTLGASLRIMIIQAQMTASRSFFNYLMRSTFHFGMAAIWPPQCSSGQSSIMCPYLRREDVFGGCEQLLGLKVVSGKHAQSRELL